MNFLELTKKRFSVRNYKSDRVEQDKIDYIIECARLAPSAVNYQPWHFMVVASEEQKQNLRQCYNREWFARAPVYIVVCADKSIAWVRKSDNKNHADIDIGLGSCWVCNFDPELFKANFGLSSERYPVAIVSLGYIQEQPDHFTTRKDKDEIVTFL